MAEQNIDDVRDALDDLLNAEREALLSGDLDQIGRMVSQKETLVADLSGADVSDISRLQQKLARNQILLDRALLGIRSVANRLGSLRRIRRSLETYDQTGRKSALESTNQNRVEKRA
ncbi:flagellar biosynthesis protein FlgN [Primorskyibacter marinus]|uniref:flagellar biosynthesis protein FlgN n=1 Tax=Primorskyibacter marinus TaxID=1977320 RepID=UPI000E30823D|nr:flagellar biosynthesis protein FlgN [Primorskyibacter marinus]